MKVVEVLRYLVTCMVMVPDAVQVQALDTAGQTIVLELRVHPDDVGKIIGREGRIANGLRAVLGAVAGLEGRKVVLEIVDPLAQRS